MATYNGAKYIREQLDDLAAQTHLPDELLVCDDGSTDGTLDIVEQFATAAPFPVRIHRNPERLGYRANFMTCAGLCTSDLIAFCDQDDRWDRNKLQEIVAVFADEEVLLAYHNARAVTERGRDIGLIYPATSKIRRLPPLTGDPWFFPLGFTQAFRRSLLALDNLWSESLDQNAGGEPLAHDQWYAMLAGALGVVTYVPLALANYRQHASNVSGMSRYWLRLRGVTDLLRATRERRQRVAAASNKAQLFRHAATQLRGEWRVRADEAARWYDAIHGLSQKRSEIYDAQGAAQRASALIGLIRSGGYGRAAPRLSMLALVLDTFVGPAKLFPLLDRVVGRVRHFGRIA